MSTVDPIKIQGLREFQAALKNMDGETQKQLRTVFNSVAETVAAGARRKIPTRTGATKASVRVLSTQREARVVAGNRKVLHYGWLDFGGRTGIKKSIKRPFIKDGRYLYPTYRFNRTSIQSALEKGLVDLAESVGFEVS